MTEITKITVKGYKSLYEESSIEIRPLTIIAGANSSGKSSIMQPLLLMKQTLESSYDPGCLLLNGDHIKFTSTEQFFSKYSNIDQSQQFSVKIDLDEDQSITNVYGKDNNNFLQIQEVLLRDGQRNIKYYPEIDQIEMIKILIELNQNNGLITYYNIEEYLKEEYQQRIIPIIIRNRCFLDLQCEVKNILITEENGRTKFFSSPIPQILCDTEIYTNLYIAAIRKIIHLPGLRGTPERTYQTTAINHQFNEFSGTFEHYVASIIYNWQQMEDDKIKELEQGLLTLGLGNKIEAKRLNDVELELKIAPGNDLENNTISIADVGIGVSQIMPILVALIVAKPGQLVYLEQPEIHLHPRAQVALAEILAKAANRGVKLVVETHSALLLLAIQSLVAEEKLSTDKVKLYWFTKQPNGSTKISESELDETGAYGDFPIDFGDVSLKLESRYLDAAEAKLFSA